MDHTGCMNGQMKTSELILPAFRVLFPMSITIVQSMWLITARQRSCGKVMFLLVSVCPQGVSISGPMSFPGGWVSLVPGPLQGGGVDMSRGWVCPEDGCVCRGWIPTSTPLPLTPSGSHYMCGLHMGGTNPTGMPSCIDYATPFHVLICITNFEFCIS